MLQSQEFEIYHSQTNKNASERQNLRLIVCAAYCFRGFTSQRKNCLNSILVAAE